MPVSPALSLDSLTRTLQDFLASARNPVVIEEDAVMFDLRDARYSVAEQHGKCLLHLWSGERNAVRRVLDAEQKKDRLLLSVLRFGQSRPITLEICARAERRTPAGAHAARAAYQRVLGRVLEREFLGYKLDRMTSAADLERSFGPVYARGLLRRGTSAIAVLGVNAQETQVAVDGALTCGILWLESCREKMTRGCVEGLAIFAPERSSGVLRARMAHLRRDVAQWRLFELDERTGEVQEQDCDDRGNIATRLVHCLDETSVRERFMEAILRVEAMAADVQVAVLSAGEVAFRLHGLEFARARVAQVEGSFRTGIEIVFGVGPEETVLDDGNYARFSEMVRWLEETRQAHGGSQQPLWRMCPERWLESIVVGDVAALDARLDGSCVYSQVPAFSASDRAMIDVLAATREGRLAVIELKADEDIHLPLQGLDYWARVRWHQQRGEFQRFGYFAGRELSQEPPLLMLVAPALHIHPATDTLLRYLSPEIEWQMVAVDERWREGVRVTFRKHAGDRGKLTN